ncbi:MAG TPA: hypothetical protein VJZ27_19265 [Aggregatilineales bacterium]|nr:hypothetical protein [Aggregatilineales bacterium]
MQYWTHLYTWRTWQEFLQHGGNITGFPERRWNTVQQMQPGDFILCYLIGVSRYLAILEVTGEAFTGYKPIWSERVYPARIPVRIVMDLLPEYGIPVVAMANELSYFKNITDPRAWSAHFRSSPIKETQQDAEIVINALEIASEDPTFRDFDSRKLERHVRIYETQSGVVTIPEDTQPFMILDDDDLAEDSDDEAEVQPITHEEIQWLLLHTGSEMGLDVWVARNDRGRAFKDEAFAEIPHLLDELPRQFDAATNRTVELIDVLWLKDNAILAAFEVEHTSAVYSGLLRMGDLVAMQPNLNIRLYIVAPDDRRDKVFAEINRPSFSRLKPPLNQICQYIPYSALKEKVKTVREFLPYIQPEFLNEIAESFEADI